jgi:hypothetical protein
MNVEIGTEVVQFLEKEYIKGIFVAVGGGGLIEAWRIRKEFKKFFSIPGRGMLE